MKIKLFGSSPLEGRMVVDGKPAKPGEQIAEITPVRFSRTQKTIFVIPFECSGDTAGHPVIDKGYITVNVKTGMLSVEHCSKPVPLDIDVAQ